MLSCQPRSPQPRLSGQAPCGFLPRGAGRPAGLVPAARHDSGVLSGHWCDRFAGCPVAAPEKKKADGPGPRAPAWQLMISLSDPADGGEDSFWCHGHVGPDPAQGVVEGLGDSWPGSRRGCLAEPQIADAGSPGDGHRPGAVRMRRQEEAVPGAPRTGRHTSRWSPRRSEWQPCSGPSALPGRRDRGTRPGPPGRSARRH